MTKRRDWSDELDEDDIYDRPSRIAKESCIVWAEAPCDIGHYWRFIVPNH